MKVRTAGVVGVSALALLLVGCGETPKASGLVDGDTKYTAAVKAVAAKTHKTSKQEKKTKRVCTSKKKNGSCKTYSDIPDGFKTVEVTVTDKPGKPSKPAKYCVQLDDVNGHTDDDDVWYNVSGTTYADYLTKDEGDSLKDMKYNHKGC